MEEDCKLYRQALDHLNEEAVDDEEETELHQDLEKVKPKFPESLKLKGVKTRPKPRAGLWKS